MVMEKNGRGCCAKTSDSVETRTYSGLCPDLLSPLVSISVFSTTFHLFFYSFNKNFKKVQPICILLLLSVRILPAYLHCK